MSFTRLDDRLVEGERTDLLDKGMVSKGAKTRKYEVRNRHDYSFMGHLKYHAHWRAFLFFPLNCLLAEEYLREIADACSELTTAHRQKRKPFPAPVQVQVVEG